MKNFEEQFNNFKKELSKSLGVDEQIYDIIDNVVANHKEEYNKLLEKIWEE